MKPLPVLLVASLFANLALVALVTTRRTAPAPSPAPAAHTAASARGSSGSSQADAIAAALAAGDAAALQAAGLSAETARELLLGRSVARAIERIRANRSATASDERWWRSSRNTAPATREQQLQSRREMSDALVATFGEDFGLFSAPDQAQQLAFLPPEKRDALRRIVQDYDEMMAKFSAGGIQLNSDRERLKLLRAERDRDIAALLSPAEREAYELRSSPTAQAVRARYGDGIESEEDFRKIYALQKSLDEKYPLDLTAGRVSPETMRQRGEAQRQMQEEMRAALGEEKYAALRRATDPDLRTVESLVSRLNLPATTTDQIASTREALAAESQRINADTALTPQQRRGKIQELGAGARHSLTQALGSEAADAYAQRSPWVSMLQNGMAYSTTPTPGSPGLALGTGPSVHPVLPAGAAPAGATNRTFTIAAPAGDAAHDALVGPAGVQVMTFSTSENSAAGGGPTTARRIMVAPTSEVPGSTTTPVPATPTPKR